MAVSQWSISSINKSISNPNPSCVYIADISTELPCLGDLENLGQIPSDSRVTRRYWWLFLMDCYNFFNIYVVKVEESFADIATELRCLSDLGNPSQLLLWEVLVILFYVCSGSVVVTAYDFESGRLGSNLEWGPIYYKASIIAQGLPEPSSLRGSTLGTRTAEHKGCNWACKLTDGCSPKSCVWPHLQWHHLAYATEIKSTQLHAAPLCSASVG